MPNTLAHLGTQALPWKLLAPDTDIKWLAFGCIIPDLPWIAQRIVYHLIPTVDLIDLKIYCMIQASLLFCLLMSGAIALLFSASAPIFLILAGNSLLHLILDAAQTKWANGVHFLAPLNWQLSQFHLFWPEHLIILILSLTGLATLLFFGIKDLSRPIRLAFSTLRLSVAALLLALYLLLPLGLFEGPLQADNHYVATLKNYQDRTGRKVGFDRCRYDSAGKQITIFTGEKFNAVGLLPERDGTISLIGRFTGARTVFIDKLHVHGPGRDLLSIVGVLLFGLFLVRATFITSAAPRTSPE
ncbi:MAG: hypothetical protein KJN87_05315 [Desulfofustis sp.]|nr:hypothetical protein [Desulfofustis sp.]